MWTVISRLNRTSVGLKPSLYEFIEVGEAEPQSNQRGIETPFA